MAACVIMPPVSVTVVVAMCEACDKVLALLKETKGINSGDWTVVEWLFPYGEPRLVRMEDDRNNTTSAR